MLTVFMNETFKCKLVSRHIYLSTVQAKENSELQVNMFQECPPYLNTLEL